MNLIRFLAIFFLIYLVVRVFRTILRIVVNDSTQKDSHETFEPSKKSEKIFSKDEGEYVDYEELE